MQKLINNKIIWLMISTIIVGVISFFVGKFVTIISLPTKIELLEKQINKMELMIGNIDGKTIIIDKNVTRVETKVDLILSNVGVK